MIKKPFGKSFKTPKETKEKKDLFVSIDYPMENEKIIPGYYAIRISSSEGFIPEVSINGKKWIECRPSVGFWWYDWDGVSSGLHTIEARIRQGSKLLKKVLRTCNCK